MVMTRAVILTQMECVRTAKEYLRNHGDSYISYEVNGVQENNRLIINGRNKNYDYADIVKDFVNNVTNTLVQIIGNKFQFIAICEK